MRRRDALRWGCAHCALLARSGFAQDDWAPPARFTRPDVASDEGGLWALMDREETRLRRSPFRLRDAPLTDYLSSLACRLGGEHCPDIRVYALRTPYFNASMAPNGMMQVWSGLLLRMDNEAQLAAVIAHEIGHYLRRHSVEMLRDARTRSAFGTFLGLFGIVGLVGQIATVAGLFAFSRDNEREADRISVALLKRSGYDAREAASVWANLLAELRATPGADPAQDSVLFATHPPSDERQQALQALAAGSEGRTAASEFRAVLKPLRHGLLEDEIRRRRPHESVALITRLLDREPGDAELLHFRGEAYRQRGVDGDEQRAFDDFEAAARTRHAPAASYRALGDLYRARSDAPHARAAWQRYLELKPDAPDAGLIRQSLEELKP